MRLRHAGASPFVRKVMVVAHGLGLTDRIELVPTSVSPVQANDALTPDEGPEPGDGRRTNSVRFAGHLRIPGQSGWRPQVVPQ